MWNSSKCSNSSEPQYLRNLISQTGRIGETFLVLPRVINQLMHVEVNFKAGLLSWGAFEWVIETGVLVRSDNHSRFVLAAFVRGFTWMIHRVGSPYRAKCGEQKVAASHCQSSISCLNGTATIYTRWCRHRNHPHDCAFSAEQEVSLRRTQKRFERESEIV